jgi:CBS domain-containing protein
MSYREEDRMVSVRSALGIGTVGEAMTAGILTCLPSTPLRTVARMMATHRVHAIVVFGNDDMLLPWGIVSDLDLVGAIESDVPAKAVAASPVVTVTIHDTLVHAAQLMREYSTSHLVVIADDSSPLPIGVLSTLDIARAFAAQGGDASGG